MSHQLTIATFLTLFGLPLSAHAGKSMKSFVSPPERVHLLEVYTSQGCSSCPPADKWVHNLSADKSLHKNFIPLTFHVDYWDSLGWKDPFSQTRFTQRQREYARSWGRASVYTPGVVLDGAEWSQWGNNATLKTKTDTVGVLRATQSNQPGEFDIEFSPSKMLAGEQWTLYAALAGSGLKTEILRGENRGKTLDHDFVVFDLKKSNLVAQKEMFVAKIKFDRLVDAKATSTEVVFWVTKSGDFKPTQAVSGKI